MGIIASGLNVNRDIHVPWDNQCRFLLPGTARRMRRTLAGVLGCEDIIVGFPLAEGLLPLDGDTDMLHVVLGEDRDGELVAMLNGGHCEDR